MILCDNNATGRCGDIQDYATPPFLLSAYDPEEIAPLLAEATVLFQKQSLIIASEEGLLQTNS